MLARRRLGADEKDADQNAGQRHEGHHYHDAREAAVERTPHSAFERHTIAVRNFGHGALNLAFRSVNQLDLQCAEIGCARGDTVDNRVDNIALDMRGDHAPRAVPVARPANMLVLRTPEP